MPTPTVHGNYNRAGASPTSGNGLATFVSLYPTPTATNTKAVHMRGADKGKERESRSYLPTPTCQDANQAGSARAKHLTLHRYVTKLYPTPAARDYRSPNAKPYAERGGGKKGEQLQNFVGGQLNPDWVEWLMNFPIRWTSLSPVQKETFDDWKRKTQSQAASPESRVPRPVRKVQSASDGQASSRLHEAVGSGFALPRMPPEGARGVLEDKGHSGCSDTMGRRLERGHVRILREDFYEEATTGEDLFKVVREQTGMEASPWFMTEPPDVPRVATGIAARVDRLKCIGNGQVPACAAEAWLRLFSRATGPQARRPAVSNLKA